MNRTDVWFLGLFALAYLYLDSRSALPFPAEGPEEDRQLPAAGTSTGTALVRVTPREACPRNLAHQVSLRSDGAMWCLSCDEGFYPEMAIWGALTGSAAA